VKKLLKVILIYPRRFLSAIKNQVIVTSLGLKYDLTLGRGSRINADIKCGNNVKIGEYSRIGLNVILGNNVKIGGSTSLRNISIGDNSHIDGGVKIMGIGSGKIAVGKESYIGVNNVLDFSDNIRIGDFVHIAGPSTGLWTHSSTQQALKGIPLKDKNINFRPTAPILIEDNVYIGGNCTIYPGIKIGNHSIIAPNSAVTMDVEPNTMVGGVPARIIKKLN
jgi:acetyltransferase-like isoleucine patch superfamily enzyme